MKKCIEKVKDNRKKYMVDNVFFLLSALMWTFSIIALIVTYVFDNSVPEPVIRGFIVAGSFTAVTLVLPLMIVCYIDGKEGK